MEKSLGEKPLAASRCCLPAELPGEVLSSPETMCDEICEMPPTREAHSGLDDQGFQWGCVMLASDD